ncbi:MAG: AAA family ATPase [Pseudomonadota bacterium]
MVERIMIIGGPGSGKSTLARSLGDISGLPVVHLDRLFLQPGWTNIGTEAMSRLALEEAVKPRWILDGNYSATWGFRVQKADLLVFLDLPRTLRMLRIRWRLWQYRGRPRPDLKPGLPERFDPEFWDFARSWDGTKRDQALNLIKDCHARGRPKCVILRSRRAVTWFVQEFKRSV